MPGMPTFASKKDDTNGTSTQVLDRMKAPGSVDILVAIALLLVGAAAALALPEGSVARLILALPVILFAPGYLLIQAIVGGAPPTPARLRHGLLAIGVSPALVGLLALATALVPGGFRPAPIIITVTVVSLMIGLLALYRRSPEDRSATTRTADPMRTS